MGILANFPLRYREIIEQFRLIDDTFFTTCFDNDVECMQLLLRVILADDGILVKSVATQRNVANLYGRGVRFDVLAQDSKGRLFNCEIQRQSEGANPRRARFNQSMLDSRELQKGIDFSSLPDTYIIFITEKDIFKRNLPLYRVEQQIAGTDLYFEDGRHIIYVNGAVQDNTPLGLLMQDFFQSNPACMNYSVLKRRAEYFKSNAKGVSAMCELMEKYGREENEKGIKKGLEKGWLDSVRGLVETTGWSVEKAMEMMKIPMDARPGIAQAIKR